jgi:hypothetical protein
MKNLSKEEFMIEQLLPQAVELVKSGQKGTARDLLLTIVESDQTNETAWLWLVETLENDQQRMRALERCLKFIPDSQHAQHGLEKLITRQKEFVSSEIIIEEHSTIELNIHGERLIMNQMAIKANDTEFVEEERLPEISKDLSQMKLVKRRWIGVFLGLLGLLVLFSVIAGSVALSQYLWPARDGSFYLYLFLG